MKHLRERIKWILFPGLNLHARLRGRLLPSRFGSSQAGHPCQILDAGCGNGMLAYHAWTRHNRVTGISIKEGEIARNRRLFHDYLNIPAEELDFRVHNIYDADQLGVRYDEIICTEVLEHIADDAQVCRSFHRLLKTGGVLHLCCPNSDHPDNREHEIDHAEGGGHVRSGYTLEKYKSLLEPIGFRIEECLGLGGPLRQFCNKWILRANARLGLAGGLALFLLCLPVHWVNDVNPSLPYSLYVRAVKSCEDAQ
jgi:SAM-dependent methyltransferase